MSRDSDLSSKPIPTIPVAGRGRRRLAVGALATTLALGAATIAAADPAATFSIDDPEPVRGQEVTFTASAPCGGTVTCSWSGDGGLRGEGGQVKHAFTELGVQRVTLTVDDSAADSGDPQVLTREIEVVNQAPRASFTQVVSGLGVAFTAVASDADAADSLTYAWDFGDGTTGSGARANHTYATSDRYPVRLTVSDGRGGTSTVSRDVLVNRPPVVAIDVSAQDPAINQAVTFTARASDPDGDGLTRVWQVDGVTDLADGATATITRTFSTSGPHTVRLTVTDDHGARVTATTVVEVANRLPTGTVTAVPASPLTDEPVALAVAAEDADGGTLEYEWDLDGDGFDDGTGASLTALTFGTPETRTVRVRVTDENRGQVVESLNLKIRNRPPSADFGWSPAVVERGRPVTFTSRASDPEKAELAEQSWDLDGDGAYDDAFGASATHTFNSKGAHEVGLRVRDSHGDVAVGRLPVILGNRAPVAAFTISPERPVAGQTLELVSQSSDPDGTVSGLAWDLDGDGAFDDATGPRASRQVTKAGPASIGLRVVDEDGGADVTTRSFDVGGSQTRAVPDRRAGKLLKPFPTVRVAGRLTRSGALFRLVSVRAPRGAQVSWSCSSRRCRGSRRAAGTKTMRIPSLERSFAAGTVLEFRVTRPGWIGKYTRIQVRRNRAPARRDMCLRRVAGRPLACPS